MTGQPMSAGPADAAAPPAAGPGANALGDYVIGARHARREHADVYEATHTPTGGARLVYVLRPGAMQDNPLVHRAVCEADAARWLRHPAVAKVDGWGDTPNRRMYVAVERPAGRPLGEAIAERGPMAPRQVVRLGSRLVEALDEAHAVALVHGRLTPDAVVVGDGADAAGPARVTLTGLGAAAIALDGPVTDAERPYVSPEQMAGRAPDARSDVFGLASLLHYVLHGAPPGAAPEEALGPTDQVLAAARAADPAQRPATVKAFWDDLLAALVADAAEEASRVGKPAAPSRAGAKPAPFELELDVIESAGPSTWSVGVGDTAERAAAPAPEFSFGGLDMSATRAPAVPAEPAWSAPEPEAREPWAAPADTWQGSGGTATVAPPARRPRGAMKYAWLLAIPVGAAAVAWPLAKGRADARDTRAGEAVAASAPATPAPAAVMPAPSPAPAAPTPPMAVAAAEPAAPAAPGAAAERHAGRKSHDASESKADTPSVRLPRVEMPDLAMPGVQAPQPSLVVRSDEFAERRLLAKPKP